MATYLFLAISFLLLVFPMNLQAQTTFTVDCVNGTFDDNLGGGPQASATPLQSAINLATSGDRIDILAGTCTENVNVTRRIRFVGASAANTIIDGSGDNTSATFRISDAAAGIRIEDMTIQNGRRGVDATRAVRLRIRDTIIETARRDVGTPGGGDGLRLKQSNARLQAVIVRNNENNGVRLQLGASLEIRDRLGSMPPNSQITGNARNGVSNEASALEITEDTLIDGNTNSGVRSKGGFTKITDTVDITNNGTDGVDAIAATVSIQDSVNIANNGGNGINAEASSIEVQDNVTVTGHNPGAGLFLSNGSAGAVEGNVSFTNNKTGAFSFDASRLFSDGGTFSNNSGNGIRGDFKSVLRLINTDISNNGVNGIVLKRDSLVVFNGGNTIDSNGVGNNGRPILCASNSLRTGSVPDVNITNHDRGVRCGTL